MQWPNSVPSEGQWTFYWSMHSDTYINVLIYVYAAALHGVIYPMTSSIKTKLVFFVWVCVAKGNSWFRCCDQLTKLSNIIKISQAKWKVLHNLKMKVRSDYLHVSIGCALLGTSKRIWKRHRALFRTGTSSRCSLVRVCVCFMPPLVETMF